MDNQKQQQQNLQQQQQESSSNSSLRINRNLLERNRRIQMNTLLSKLFSLVPQRQQALIISMQFPVCESVDQATSYIRKLEEKIKKLRERKEVILKGDHDDHEEKFEPVVINVKSSESTLEVSIISGLKKKILLHQVISVLVEEGAEVVNITYHNTGGRVFHTIYSKPIYTRIGIETSRVDERLKKLIS
ncbi:hypothetical protein Dsin_010338 [Dipteronia sinensis]|uniref:BHLH domain-containing protein n=1 Tax=Dipteronia sinensis TaxID=43782 RepID=A0AAE0ECH4_9ROSI|nr:hypothetical protein Dsin_010338 [Dipteronia sinensis]